MNLWHGIDAGKNAPGTINVIVEIPKGSQNKYEYDKEYQVLKLNRTLFSALHYPGDYGFIPGTLAEDADPLDALVLITNPTYPGILLNAKPIGILKMIDTGQKDYKILCTAKDDPRYANYKDVSGMEEHILKEIWHFFQVYKMLEGKKVSVEGWGDGTEAKSVVMNAVKLYKETFPRNK